MNGMSFNVLRAHRGAAAAVRQFASFNACTYVILVVDTYTHIEYKYWLDGTRSMKLNVERGGSHTH